MSDIKSWSETAANNNSAAPNGFPEGMAPSGVNDAAREVMGAVRRWTDDSGWHNWGHTYTYASATSFTIATDVTAIYHAGRRVRAVGAGTGTIYGSISSSSYGAPNTTVNITWDSGSLANEAITISVGYLAGNNLAYSIGTTQIQTQSYTSAAAGGTVDVITATISPVISALTDKLRLCIIAAGANATTTPTFAPNGLTAKTIVKGSNQALVIGDIPGANFPMDLEYNAALTKWVLMNPAYAVSTPGLPRGFFSRLNIKNNVATPATKIDLSADSVMVEDVSGNLLQLKSFAKTVNCGVSGDGDDRLDTGALVNGTWYHFFATAKADGTTGSRASTSATDPSMQTGYTYKKLVSSIYYRTATFDIVFPQAKIVYRQDKIKMFTTTAAWAAYDVAAFVPPNALTIKGQVSAPVAGQIADVEFSWTITGSQRLVTYSATSSAGFPASLPFELLLNPAAPQTIYAYSANASYLADVYITSYELDI